MTLLFVNIVLLFLSSFSFLFCGLIMTPYPNRKATGTAGGVLRASQGRLYPPWSLMLAINLVTGSRRTRVCKLHAVLKRSSGEFLFFSKYQIERACKVLPLTAEIRPQRKSTVIGVSELPIYSTFSSR
jgi:hypothetical protein